MSCSTGAASSPSTGRAPAGSCTRTRATRPRSGRRATARTRTTPILTVQRLVFVNGRASGTATMDGGGAIFVRGGRLRVIDSQFYGNRCAPTGPDVGGAAIQVFSQSHGLPVYVVRSTFGGSGDRRNECSNGGAISSIGVSWTILNSLFTGNHAIGTGANPAEGRHARRRQRRRHLQRRQRDARCTSRGRASRATPRTTRAGARSSS